MPVERFFERPDRGIPRYSLLAVHRAAYDAGGRASGASNSI